MGESLSPWIPSCNGPIRVERYDQRTTIGRLLPLMFETSLQVQFLIPMATYIALGLGGSTLLVLFIIPALLSWVEQGRLRLKRRHTVSAQ